MRILSDKKILLIFAMAFFAIVFIIFFKLLSFPDSSIVLEKGELFVLQPNYSLSQTFLADRDNLMKIEFLMRTPGPKKDDIVKMEIADETCSDTLRTGELEKSSLDSKNLYYFQFPEIADSENKVFCLKANFVPGHTDSKYIRFFLHENTKQEFILMDASNEIKIENQSLAMRPAYKNENIAQDVNELNQRISQYKPWFLKHYYLYGISFLFIALSFSLVIIVILL